MHLLQQKDAADRVRLSDFEDVPPEILIKKEENESDNQQNELVIESEGENVQENLVER